MLTIRLLGQLSVELDGTPIDVRRRPKNTSLLAHLLLHRDHPVPRDRVAFDLWPDVPETEARANLRRHLYHLRRALPPSGSESPWILSEGRTLRWNPNAASWIDVAEFERLVASDETLDRAVTLYRGDLLPDVYDDWLFYERDRLQSLYLTALSRLVLLSRSRRDHAGALAYAQELLREDPLREDALRQVMLIQYETGNRAGALAEYEAFVRRLRHELGVEPMPESAALYKTIARNAPLEPVPETPEVTRSAPQIDLPFVGREDALEQLHTWWSRAAQGRGRVVFISGEAGIGKTRLVSEFAATAKARGGRTLHGSTAFAEPVPYQALVEALRSALPLLAALDVSPLWLAALLPILPGLRSRLPDLKPAAPLGADQERQRLFEAIARSLAGLARPRPVLLVLEDLHWASSSTIDLLSFLAQRVGQAALLVLITHRVEETPRAHPLRRLRRRLRQRQLASHLALSPLPRQAIVDLVQRMAGLGVRVDALGATLYAGSEGNPLFVRELIQEWLETGQIRLEAGHWQVGSVHGVTLPDSLRALIVGRLQRLNEGARALGEIVAVVGPAFDIELAREVSGWEEGRVLDALDALMDHYLVQEAGAGTFNYTFTHQLIQTVLYEGLAETVRQRRHRRIARVMEDLYPDRLHELAGTLARHFDLGGLDAPAARYYLQATRSALAMYADDEALVLIERSLTLAPPPGVRFELLALRERIHNRQGQREAQQADLAELIQLAQMLDENDLLCRALSRQIDFYYTTENREAERTAIADLQALAERIDDPRWQAQALRSEARLLVAGGHYTEAQSLLGEALARYRRRDDKAGQVACYCLLAKIATHRGDFSTVSRWVEEARALAEAEANYELMIQAVQTAAKGAFVRQAFEVSKRLCLEGLALSRQIGFRAGEAEAHQLLGALYGRLSEPQEARRHYDRADELYRYLDKKQGHAAVQMNLGILNMTLGRYQEGAAAFREAGTLFDELEDLRGQLLSRINLTAVALLEEDYKTAKPVAEQALSLAQKLESAHLQATALSSLAEAERELGQLADAVAHAEAGLTLRRALDAQPADLGHDLCQLVLTHLQRGDFDAACEVADELLAVLKAGETGLLYPQQTFWAAAQAYRASGDIDRADELLQTAHARMQEETAATPDPEARVAYLRLRFNREIVAAHERDEWPPLGPLDQG